MEQIAAFQWSKSKIEQRLTNAPVYFDVRMCFYKIYILFLKVKYDVCWRLITKSLNIKKNIIRQWFAYQI